MPDLRFDPERALEVAAAVAAAGGAEVFFGARVDAGGTIVDVAVLARGDEEEVPAVLATLDAWDLVLHNHPRGDLRPSKADLRVAAIVAESGKGFAVTDNEAAKLYVVAEPVLPEEAAPVDPEAVEEFFGPGGPLARTVGEREYEERPGQVAMALAVAEAFNRNQVLAVEAGTGSGKSFAYLVPAILYARANRTHVIVATGTINLQEQLIGKDLPVLAEAFRLAEGSDEAPFRYSHMKGRGNYACVRRIHEIAAAPQQLELFSETDAEREVLAAIIRWSATTEDGSLSDLPFQPRADTWEKVASDADRCTGTRCADFKGCFYYRARIQASRSEILVVNHHLFFADLAVRREGGNYSAALVLPAWRHVIFDEAHDLEEAASSFFGVSLSEWSVLRRLGRLRSQRDPNRGVIPALCAKLMAASEAARVAEIQGLVYPALDHARDAVGELYAQVADLVGGALGSAGAGAAGGEASETDGGERSALRYRGEEEPWNAIFEACAETAGAIGEVRAAVDEVLKPLAGGTEKGGPLESAIVDLEAVTRRLEGLRGEIVSFADAADTENVRWVELRGGGEGKKVGAHLRAAPFLVGPILEEGLWRRPAARILTSATLSVDGKIDYLASRLGLDALPPHRRRFAQVASPFAWSEQAIFLVPTDMAEVTSRDFEGELARWIVAAARITRGRAFVLFTSYRALERAHRATAGELAACGFDPMRQGEMPRTRLLERFKESGRGVLFGTESFWQGVDVRGDALSCVLIARLPFAVPTEPLQVARMEEVEARGGNAFRDYSLPQAVLKLRQGVGRLIRSRTDRGAIVVLDRRIASKRYGKVFMRSLPPFRVMGGAKEELLGALEEFFAKELF